MRLLAVGDMHLGRVPVALPRSLAESARAFGPETAWQRAVDRAVADGVDAVLLAGDVVDRERDFFAGLDALKRGIERLADHGVAVVAVAGNHDTEVLPRLADTLPGLRLLGRGGRWESLTLGEIDVVGWSFPSRHVVESPLARPPEPTRDRPVIGLVHGDLDQPGSRYAPLDSAALSRVPVSAWLLGHVHAPHPLDRHPVGYLGSITALRATDTGARGPWRIDVVDGRVRATHCPDAPLAFDELEIGWHADDDPGELLPRLVERARERVAERIGLGALPDALGLRVRVRGEAGDARRLAEQCETAADDEAMFEHDGCQVFFQRVIADTRPALDLAELARRPDPLGLLARDLRTLEGPDGEERRALVEAGREAVEAAGRAVEFRALDDSLDDDAVADWLARAARRALSELAAQKR